jgi:hypothetical protein
MLNNRQPPENLLQIDHNLQGQSLQPLILRHAIIEAALPVEVGQHEVLDHVLVAAGDYDLASGW